MNEIEFFHKVVQKMQVKNAELIESFDNIEEIKSLCIELEKPLKFSVQRDEGFCFIIADALDFSNRSLSFVFNNYEVLLVTWGSLKDVKWEDCPDDDYLEELKNYENWGSY